LVSDTPLTCSGIKGRSCGCCGTDYWGSTGLSHGKLGKC